MAWRSGRGGPRRPGADRRGVAGEATFHYTLVLTREEAVGAEVEEHKEQKEQVAKRLRTVRRVVRGRRVDATRLQAQLAGMADGDGLQGSRGAAPAMTIISGPDGFNAHCEALVCRTWQAEHELVVLDA